MDLQGFNSIHLREEYLDKNQGFMDDSTVYLEEPGLDAETIAEELLNSKADRSKKTRCLSASVGSLWYRSPEIALVERHYD